MNQSDNHSNTEAGREDSRAGQSIFMKWFIGYFLVALLGLMGHIFEQHQQRQERQEELMRSERELRGAVRRGEAGEAFNRLYSDDYESYLEDQRRAGEAG